ncbi:pentatricopeptide repeat-containing protein At1g80550, mitochondrial [Amborella trichopoda]|uniref:Pentacotripeptide-repeat region of PRORP domain-containing protein n=1 Tax=Amborella trichopoda TaxID=13333 RepID=U5CMA4_AMBTC|nr:pentatricopeptide repeat-containing protein At1g80550, mitochondrial [Amborella trichopoda]XP_020528098.1 pentatricopeptide repeat-containing protein At1g80550, mitochondrial [Amborella trichopoda]XP_020528099.1 pentatricopeptide repeat-containing protein At1g80550, mitochondrial [Amborella trichopoda]XP_020528100.1 pentatricopeptide repeat-containing protein At1g80550, mitochondrial [Amborella trichopoda]XP_020528101.1 pentatricopeptide repeat-containing protein At1g80550, mitochondrial [Am|eukprot:XP_006852794.1 pentatricopeptide repeat-containing protein At1g80550, mitochondrial [Amborella trichopoda]
MREINVKADHKIVEKTIRSFTNNWKIAYNFFNWADTQSGYEHSTGVCNLMLDILGKALEFDLCEKLIEKLREKSGLADQTTFRIMFKRYASAHMVKEAIEIYQKMEDFKLKDKTAFFTLIDALCEHKHVTEAEELALGKDREFPIETKTYNIVIRGWCKLGWWQKCRSFWEEMDQKGIARDLYSYTIYMGILIKMNKPWKAVKLYDEMKERGIVFDTAAYNTVIHALGLANEVRKSLQVYHEMVDTGCPPNIVTYNTIIKLLCRTGRITEAYDLLEQMPSNGYAPNAITYHCFFSSLSEPKALLDLFDRMVESGCSPIMETYVMLIKKFGSLGYLRPVFHVWKVMEERGCSPDEFAYNALIDALIQKGRLDLARKYDEEMLARGVSLRPRKELQMKSLGGNSDYEIDDF